MNTPDSEHAVPAACDNCATPLAGDYCSRCGQHAHNPLRSFGHAVEEVFESFWHLDGRIVRTLHDLLFPGRLPVRFLRGHRAPYVPPLRLFVVLSVLTFFVAQYAIHLTGTDDPAQPPMLEFGKAGLEPDAGQFAGQTTVSQVLARRDAQLAELEKANAQAANLPGISQATRLGARRIRVNAQARIHQLDPSQPAIPANTEDTAVATGLAEQGPDVGSVLDHFDPAKHPVHIDALPGFANRWINRKLARALINVERYREDPAEGLHVFIAAIPSALFVLVPVFALLLKVFYLGSGRGYLEHLVVGLYSHAYMVLSLLGVFALMLLAGVVPPGAGWLSWGCGALRVLILLWVPVYLWLTQSRTYGEPWWLSTIKYMVIGNLYFVLVFMGALMVAFNGITH